MKNGSILAKLHPYSLGDADQIPHGLFQMLIQGDGMGHKTSRFLGPQFSGNFIGCKGPIEAQPTLYSEWTHEGTNLGFNPVCLKEFEYKLAWDLKKRK